MFQNEETVTELGQAPERQSAIPTLLERVAQFAVALATGSGTPEEIHGLPALIAEKLGADRCALWLLDTTGTHLLLTGRPVGFEAENGSPTPMSAVLAQFPNPGRILAAPEDVPLADSAVQALCAALSVPPATLILLPAPGGTMGLWYVALPADDLDGPSRHALLRIVAAELARTIQARQTLKTAGITGTAKRLLLVQQTAHALAAVTSTEAVCDTLAETIYSSMGYHIVGVYLSDGSGLNLATYRLALGMLQDEARQQSYDTGVIGHVWTTNRPYLCHDTYTDPYYHRSGGSTGGGAELAVPLRIGSTIIGVLNVENREPHSYSEDDVATLTAVADQAGVALQNARLYEAEAALRRRAEERANLLLHIQRIGEHLKQELDEREVGPRIVQATCEALGFRGVALALVDRPGDPISRVRVAATAGVPAEGMATLLAHDFPLTDVTANFRPEFLLSRSYFTPAEANIDRSGMEMPTWSSPLSNTGANAWQTEDRLMVPLIDHVGGDLYGFLAVDDPESGRRPTQEEVEALEIFADQAVVAYMLARARRQAERDPVTGLLNHRAATVCLERAIVAAQSRAEPLSLIAIDIDYFKLINDTHGHLTGDGALRHVARSIRNCVRADDHVARMGGDEFLAILPGMAVDGAVKVVQRLMALLKEDPLHIEGVGAVPLRLSAGIAVCPTDAEQPNALFAVADARLYEAKRSGGRDLDIVKMETARDPGELAGFDVLSALVAAVDNKDRYTHEHSEQVASFACGLAEVLGLSRENQRTLRIAGLLHDVGKIGVPDRILRKPGALNADEWETMKQHAALSTTLISMVGLDSEMLTAVAHHHERWDGSGYPEGLAGTEISLLGRIMIVANAASAMALDRPYRAGLDLETMIGELRAKGGSQFDPALVEPFIAKVLRVHMGNRTSAAPGRERSAS
jgi:diguanylate cyclase (GGDEF)-like protein/putative nucleotidyltransferase with HDIG domain